MLLKLIAHNRRTDKDQSQKLPFELFNPFMPNGSSHHYQLDKSILKLRVVGVVCFINSIQILKVYL